ncbi:MAG: carbohydrate kinase [Burkholderiales bacterium]|nr:carbohydrate kinase [Burkholderiales bacterium]
MKVVLACDLGGTSFRAALVDAQGIMQAQSMVPTTSTTVGPMGWSEFDATDCWRDLIALCASLAASAPQLFDAVQAVAICGMTRTQVFLGRDGQQLRYAMRWDDSRSEDAAKRLTANLPTEHPELGNLNAFHPLARLAWLRDEEAVTFKNLSTVLEPKDYLNFRLTGRQAGDAISMARLLACTERVNGIDLLHAIGASSTLLPLVLEPCGRVGDILPGHPSPLDRLVGVPVFCCSNDTWAAAAGLGALKAGRAYNISGTTEVLGVMSERPAAAQGLLTVDWSGLYMLGGPSQNGADTARWLSRLLGSIDDDHQPAAAVGHALNGLLAGRRHSQPLLFLPYLQGERVPYWDPSLRGAFIGLGRHHGATDLAFAVLEGVAFQNRVVLERAEAAIGQPVTEIRFGGGGAFNPVWRQIKADICGRPIVIGESAQPGTLGAAIVAWTGLGHFASLSQAQAQLVKIVARHEPNAERATAYQRLFDLYRRSEQSLAPISRDLVGLSLPTPT